MTGRERALESAPMSRRRRQQRLERVLGTPALFSTAYGNVGSSIYYALGVVAVYALGPDAGRLHHRRAHLRVHGRDLRRGHGATTPRPVAPSSFARHAFNELVSFEAAWAQMLNYIATIAVSAFFVPHYLSVFWAPLRQNPWDVVFGIVVIVLLVLLNIVGIQESAKVNIFLAVADFATQVLLVLLGFVLVFSPEILKSNVHLGVAPTWSSFFLSIPIAMLAYTGIETVSNLSEEARDPLRTIPRAVLFVAIAVFTIYFTLPWVALSAMPVEHVAGDTYKTLLALPPTETFQGQHGYQNDPVLGLVNNLGLNDALTHVLQIYLGILASTILFIGANAGVIGASRITYAMSGYRQLPLGFRKIHPRFKTPWVALIVFGGAIPIGLTLSGKTSFLGAIYAFGATFSFTVAHAAIVRMRMQQASRGTDIAYQSRFNLRYRGVNWPLFAILGGLGTGLSWLVIVIQTPSIRYTGIRVAGPRLRLLRGLSAAHLARPADRDGSGPGRDRACDGARVPQRARAGRLAARVGGGGRPRVSPRDRARGLDHGDHRDRGSARVAAGRAARRRDARPRGHAARRGSRDRGRVRRERCRAVGARAAGRARDRRRGGAAQQRDHRHGLAATRPATAAAAGSSAAPSTSSSRTRRAA
jgi:APA family basic amino acid/polyamine antiporter